MYFIKNISQRLLPRPYISQTKYFTDNVLHRQCNSQNMHFIDNILYRTYGSQIMYIVYHLLHGSDIPDNKSQNMYHLGLSPDIIIKYAFCYLCASFDNILAGNCLPRHAYNEIKRNLNCLHCRLRYTNRHPIILHN